MQKGGQALLERVDKCMRHGLCSGTELKHRKDLGEGIDGQPEPQNLLSATEPGAQLVQLQVREMEMAEEALVESVRVLSSTRQPGGNGGLPVAENSRSCRSVQPFGQRREHHGDLPGRGFQTIQGGVASRAERGLAGLTAKRLDPLCTAMRAIAAVREHVLYSSGRQYEWRDYE